MRRLLAITLVIVAAVALVVFGAGAGDDSGGYRVRAIFDNAGFAIPGMDVKIAGVKVGQIESLDVTKDKKAAIVLAIDDENYQDWRSDATCRIRPQSLIGEKYVECVPTQPKSAGDRQLPPLKEIGSGDGEGQRLLPATQTSRAVDLDLINNIMRLPYRERFTIIVNEFGVGLAGNGAALQTALKKSDPALKAFSDVLKILADQNKTLVALADNGDKVLRPLARDRAHFAGFIKNAGITAEATAERSVAFRENLRKFPGFLEELGPTMDALGEFSDSFSPVIEDLNRAAPELNAFVTGTPAFTDVSTPALVSLGEASNSIGPSLQKSLPLIKDLGTLGKSTVPLTKNLSALLLSLREQDGIKNFLDFVFLGAGSFNGYDEFGHYVRARLTLGTCQTYVETNNPSCTAKFDKEKGAVTTPAVKGASVTPVSSGAAGSESSAKDPATVGLPEPIKLPAALLPGDRSTGKPAATTRTRKAGAADERDVQPLLDYLLGE